MPGDPLTEILDVLLGNARAHGHGTVSVRMRDLDNTLVFDVTDEGEVRGDTGRLFDRGHTGSRADDHPPPAAMRHRLAPSATYDIDESAAPRLNRSRRRG
ncbi:MULTISPECIES: hypothetical protein [unclassified Streptomyces]|uniref:hypothetical protein n=1 Tax=unclassified Streptomyces TaxID=2593676 RepID=UPI0036F93BF7